MYRTIAALPPPPSLKIHIPRNPQPKHKAQPIILSHRLENESRGFVLDPFIEALSVEGSWGFYTLAWSSEWEARLSYLFKSDLIPCELYTLSMIKHRSQKKKKNLVPLKQKPSGTKHSKGLNPRTSPELAYITIFFGSPPPPQNQRGVIIRCWISVLVLKKNKQNRCLFGVDYLHKSPMLKHYSYKSEVLRA